MKKRKKSILRKSALLPAQGQAALETILVMSLIIIFLIFIVQLDKAIISTTESEYTIKKMGFTMESLVQSTNLVYQQGVGAKTKVKLAIPGHVKNITVGKRTINATLNISGSVSQIYRTFPYEIHGTIPKEQGTYWFIITAHETGVNISLLQHP
ncbi:MAG: hypothetical protein QW594_00595 [Candidatus Woesearchaeota archaeon]